MPTADQPMPRSELSHTVHAMLAAANQIPSARTWRNSPVCQRCDGPCPVWWTPDSTWLTGVFGTKYRDLCPVCFIGLAEIAGVGVAGAWQLYPPASLM